MSDQTPDPKVDLREFDGTFEGTRRRQILLGLSLEPLERLRWLERTMAELRELQGRACSPETDPPE